MEHNIQNIFSKIFPRPLLTSPGAALLDTAQQWARTPLQLSAVYGPRRYSTVQYSKIQYSTAQYWPRRYGRGAALALHVDRLSSHVVSAIINIQQVGSLDAETRVSG